MWEYSKSKMIYCAEDKIPITLLWPSRKIYEDIPSFLPKGDYVFYTDNLSFDDKYNPIIVKKSLNIGKNISNKKDFLDVLIFTRNLNLNEEYRDLILQLDDCSFWKAVKILCVTTISKTDLLVKKPLESYALYEHIFKGYSRTFEIFYNMKESHNQAISSLITMFCACLLSEEELVQKYKIWFSSVTRENKKYFSHFQRCLLSYLQSNRREIDFLTFLEEIFPY